MGSGATADLGLATERTALAWQRTALSLVASAAILARLTVSQLGSYAIALLGVAIVLCLWVFVESRWRYAQLTGARLRRRARGGRAQLFLALSTCLLAITEVAALLV